MKLNIKELLDFFDNKEDSQKGDAVALMSIMGEDLNAAVYRHFRKNKIDILGESITQGFKGGKYLDRWILDKNRRKLFQCEIKSWAATAIGGKELKSGASYEDIKKVAEYHWNREKNSNFSNKHDQPNGVTKVLLAMHKPERHKKLAVESLLIYWMPINKKGLNPLSVLSIKQLKLPIETKFSKLSIFSVSLYLRQLYKKGKRSIDLNMPNFEHRMKILKKIQNKK